MSHITISKKEEKMLTRGSVDAYFGMSKNRSGFEIEIDDVTVWIDGYDARVLKHFLEAYIP